MKKYYLIQGLLIIFLGITHIAFATSGACSYHGGVNCSVGSGPLGNAICNDGTESSTSFYETQECSVNRSSCVAPLAGYCKSASDYIKHCGNPSQYTSDMYDTCHAACESQINQYQNDLANYNSCLSQQSQQRTASAPPQSVQQIIQNQQDHEKATAIQTQLMFNNQCQELNGPYAQYDQITTSCVCQTGYRLDSSSDQCKLPAAASNTPTPTQPTSVQSPVISPVVPPGRHTLQGVPVNPQADSQNDPVPSTVNEVSKPIDYGSPAANELLGGKATTPKLSSSTTTISTTSPIIPTITATTSPQSKPKNRGFIDSIYQFIKSLF